MDALLAASPNDIRITLSTGKNVFIGSDLLAEKYGALSSLEDDLLAVASVVYAADLAVKRNPREDFVRSIQLTLPVVNMAAFNAVRSKLEKTLRILSCDNWTLNFRAARGTPEANRQWPEARGTTLLFSGGLDSFAGACELLAEGDEAFLVSHVTHNRPISNSQQALVADLNQYFGREISHLPVMVYTRRYKDLSFPQDADREDTQRTRSFLFVTLAAVAARMNGSRRILAMAENGQFAIHLPLTSARVGPFSTHTAHPEFLHSMEAILREILSCPDLTLNNPFEHKTKSEVANLIPEKLRPSIEKSISCWMTSRLAEKTHCGECIPCISRRLALEPHNLSFDEYKRDIFAEDIAKLSPDDLGRRNLTDLLEFIAHFYGPSATTDEQHLQATFPELLNPFINRRETVSMYRRFASSATQVVGRYPMIKSLLK
jgi:7-cyano-7-deazaguanine synthase in queuosine biosynthesis